MRQHSPGMDFRTAPNSAQIVQYGFSEKWVVMLCIIIASFGLAFGVWALVRASDATAHAQALQGELRAYTEAMNAQQQTVRAKLEVVQYDHNALKAQLVAKGLYQATEH